MYTCACTHMHVYALICTYANTYPHMQIQKLHMDSYSCTYAYICTYRHIHTCAHTNIPCPLIFLHVPSHYPVSSPSAGTPVSSKVSRIFRYWNFAGFLNGAGSPMPSWEWPKGQRCCTHKIIKNSLESISKLIVLCQRKLVICTLVGVCRAETGFNNITEKRNIEDKSQ